MITNPNHDLACRIPAGGEAMESSEIRTVLEIPHKADCAAVANLGTGWTTPWSGLLDDEEPWSMLSANANNQGRWVWWRITCNDPYCPARLAVRAKDVLALLPTPARPGVHRDMARG